MNALRFLTIFIIFVAAIIPCRCYALRLTVTEPEWKNIAFDGRRTTVFTIFTDSRDIAWIGTNNGLCLYDGVTVHPIAKMCMGGVQVYSIVEEGNRLLLGTNNGLMEYDLAENRLNGPIDDSPKEIRSLLAEGNSIWIGSLYGIHRLDLSDRTIIDMSAGLPHRSVYSLMRDSRGILYAGTYAGLGRLDPGRGEFEEVSPGVSSNLFVNCLLESSDHSSIYIGTEGALFTYTPSTDSWNTVGQVSGNVVKCLARAKNGHIIAGTDDGVFELANKSPRHFRHDSRLAHTLPDNEIWCVMSDNGNNIWVGHEKGFSIAPDSETMRTIPLNALAHTGEGNDIRVIARDRQQNLWLGGTNGIIRIRPDGFSEWFRHGEGNCRLSHNRIRAFTQDSEGDILLATDGGINRFVDSENNFDVFFVTDSVGGHRSKWVYAIAEDGDSLWIGSYLGGMHHVAKSSLPVNGGTATADYSVNSDGGRFRQHPLALDNDLVNNVKVDRYRNTWVLLYRDSTLTRIARDGQTESFNILRITGNYPTAIETDSQGYIWCAYTGGVVVFDSNSPKVIRFPATGSDESVLTMGKVGDNMWVSTLSNLWRVDRKACSASLVMIPRKSVTAIFDDTLTDKVLLGSADEIIEIERTAAYGNNTKRDSIRLLLLTHDNGNQIPGNLLRNPERLTVPYNESITLTVSTLDYSPQSTHRYIYRLAESAADTAGTWIALPEGSNRITLSDLSMGDYTLLIKQAGTPARPFAIPLHACGPWWASWWAVILYVAVLSSAAALIIIYLHRRNRRKLQEAERRKTIRDVETKLTFLSNVSHDLKTPLSMIMGPVSMLKEKATDTDTRQKLDQIYSNAVKLNDMIHRTLELRTLEDTDEDMLILSTVDLVRLCNDVFEAFKSNNANKHFVFHSSCTQLLAEIDAVKLESVMSNLLSNACKYSDDGATVSCGISVADGNIEIIVSDDGAGIPSADQSLVFQRHFRSPSTSSLHEGTGIGLYLIKKYLELMGGNIELFSNEGQGSAFVVTIPYMKSDTSDRSDKADTSDITSDTSLPRVLIVEDNREIAAFIKELLQDDYACLTADNGRTGLSLAASFVPDIIILDQMMPVMSGTEMAAQLKNNPRLSHIPIIMLTAKDDNFTETESIRLGIDAFMSKPFVPSMLTARIKMLLQARNEMRQSARITSLTAPRPIEAESVSEKQLARIAQTIEDNVADPDLNVSLLCEKCGIPNKQLYRIIKKYLDISPLDYIRRVRLQKAAMLLGQHRFTVSEVSYMVGFKTPSYFAKCFQAQFGVKPSEYVSEDRTPGAG